MYVCFVILIIKVNGFIFFFFNKEKSCVCYLRKCVNNFYEFKLYMYICSFMYFFSLFCLFYCFFSMYGFLCIYVILKVIVKFVFGFNLIINIGEYISIYIDIGYIMCKDLKFIVKCLSFWFLKIKCVKFFSFK